MYSVIDSIERLFYTVFTMGAVSDVNKNIEMICQHKTDGTIIPIKIRMLDDDGAYQEYKIRAYKDMRYKGDTFELPDAGRIHTSLIYPFECKIECFGRERTIKLFYNSYERTWKLISNQRP